MPTLTRHHLALFHPSLLASAISCPFGKPASFRARAPARVLCIFRTQYTVYNRDSIESSDLFNDIIWQGCSHTELDTPTKTWRKLPCWKYPVHWCEARSILMDIKRRLKENRGWIELVRLYLDCICRCATYQGALSKHEYSADLTLWL